ncbi:Gfo/Idh/MocA family protein [Bacillus sp. 1P02SD]|uniref:Gfo/Idh/MocA family protein n=1 Tax=Bacillus sp. 1P02SD TaxID=3132264 RepID=UPI0039A09DFA
MKNVRVGLIGLGRFSQLHIQCLLNISNIKLAAVADVRKEIVDKAKSELGCHGYTDWKEMLEREELDVVHVLTPEGLHTEPVIFSLRAGCHVFVEKPLATNSNDAKEMMKVAQDYGKQLMVGHVCRFDSRYSLIKEELETGRIGKIRSLYARRNNPKKYFSIYRRSNPVFILGIHDIDLMRWYTDSHVTEVYAQSTPSTTGDVDLIWAMLTFDNGSVGMIENNWLVPDRAPSFMDVRMEIVGEDGTVHIQDPDQTITFWDNEGLSTPPIFSWSNVHGVPVGALFEELKHFYQCIFTDRHSHILNPEDALSAVMIAEAIVQSIKEKKPILIHNSDK